MGKDRPRRCAARCGERYPLRRTEHRRCDWASDLFADVTFYDRHRNRAAQKQRSRRLLFGRKAAEERSTHRCRRMKRKVRADVGGLRSGDSDILFCRSRCRRFPAERGPHAWGRALPDSLYDPVSSHFIETVQAQINPPKEPRKPKNAAFGVLFFERAAFFLKKRGFVLFLLFA